MQQGHLVSTSSRSNGGVPSTLSAGSHLVHLSLCLADLGRAGHREGCGGARREGGLTSQCLSCLTLHPVFGLLT